MADERPVVKRTARAILLDGETDPRMLLIKRTKPGQLPYWITPGGGVEPTDGSVVDALHREVDEELGARISQVVPAFVDTVTYRPDPAEAADAAWEDDGPGPAGREGVKVQHFFVCRLESMDLTRRHGPEVEAPRGEYEVVSVPFTRDGITSVEVVPPSLRRYLAENVEGVRALLAPDLVRHDPTAPARGGVPGGVRRPGHRRNHR